MLCFSVVVRRLNSYFKGVFPLLYEQVESNVWIHFLQNFLVGNIVTMFLVSIMVIYFELSSMTLRKTAGIAAAGGEWLAKDTHCKSIINYYLPTARIIIRLVGWFPLHGAVTGPGHARLLGKETNHPVCHLRHRLK